MSRPEKQRHPQEPERQQPPSSSSSSSGVLTIEQLRLKRLLAFVTQNTVEDQPSNQLLTSTAAPTIASSLPLEAAVPFVATNATSQRKTAMRPRPKSSSSSSPSQWLSSRNKDTTKSPAQYGVSTATTSSTTNQIVDLLESSSDEENDVNRRSNDNRYNIEEDDDDFMEGRKHKNQTSTNKRSKVVRKQSHTHPRSPLPPPPEHPPKRQMSDTKEASIKEVPEHLMQLSPIDRHHQHSAASTTISAASSASTTTHRQKYRYDIPSFQVATWNVWFGPWGDGSPYADVRMQAIVQLLLEQQQPQWHSIQQAPTSAWNPLYCIGFQEVVPDTKKALKLALKLHHYTWYEPLLPSMYYCAIAIHSDITVLDQGWVPFKKSEMGRGFMFVRATLPVRNHEDNANATSSDKDDLPQFIFTTTHLESYTGPDYNGSKQRFHQIKEMSTFLQTQMRQHPAVRMSMISGDLNWDDERVSSRTSCHDSVLLSLISSNWKDTWLEAHSSAMTAAETKTRTAAISKSNSGVNNGNAALPTVTYKKQKSKIIALKDQVEGFTYDAKLNPMLKGSLRRRFDRILVYDNHHDTSTRTASCPSDSTPPKSPHGLSSQQVQFYNPQLLGKVAISDDLTWEKPNTHNDTTRTVPTAPSDHFGYIVTVASKEG
jgi:hypothetical protein